MSKSRPWIEVILGAFLAGSILHSGARKGTEYFPKLEGPYLGQTPPGNDPVLFAPKIVSTGEFEHSSPVFTPDLNEIYWSVAKVYYVKRENGVWSRPALAPFNKGFEKCENPFITPDGRRLFFAARRESEPQKYDLWFVERDGSRWGEPRRIESLSSEDHDEVQPSLAKNGTLYFVGFYDQANPPYGLYFSRWENGRYATPVLMEEQFNRKYADWTPAVAPDESYFIFCSFRQGGHGSGDLYISFKQKDGSWGKVKNMGNKINGPANDRFPNVTPDGKFLFFNSTRKIPGAGDDEPGNGKGDVYWTSSRIIDYLRDNDLDVLDILYGEAASGRPESIADKFDRLKSRHAEFFNFDSSVLYAVGLRLIENRKKSEALKVFKDNGDRFPRENLVFQNVLTLILTGRFGELDRLSQDLGRRNREEKSIGIYDFSYLGDRLLEAGLARESLAVFRVNERLFPDSAGVYEALGDAYLALADKKAALEQYRKALELSPGDRSLEEKMKSLR